MHLNPARAGVLGPERRLSDFAWSSYPQYLAGPRQRPIWLRVDRLLDEWGITKDSAAGRKEFAARMEWRRRSEVAGEFKAVERGWYLEGKSSARSCSTK